MKKIGYIIFLTLFIFSHANAGNVSTILDSPNIDIDDALAFDSQGNIYGSNFLGDSVYKILPSGEASVFASGFSNPNGLAFDSHDNLYIADFSDGTIYKYDINGNQINSFSVGGYPSGLTKDFSSDSIIYTDVSNHSINKLMENGESIVLYEGEPLNTPVGLAFNESGTLFIGNYVGRQIYALPKNKPTLKYVATVPDSGTDFPYLAFIAYVNGKLVGTVYGEHKIYKINPYDTDVVEILAGSEYGNSDGSLEEATFAYPAGIIANKAGTALFVSEFSGLGNVRKITKRPHKINHLRSKQSYITPTQDKSSQ